MAVPELQPVSRILPDVISPANLQVEQTSLMAISPLDGRYHKTGETLAPYLSEWGLIRARIFVESELLKEYAQQGLINPLTDQENAYLDSLSSDFSIEDGKKIKQLEKKADHDVVAVVNFMKEKLREGDLHHLVEFIHLGPTSEDIDNIALRLVLSAVRENIIIPSIQTLFEQLESFIEVTKDKRMIGRTHGQPAGVTTLGKEMLVFRNRLAEETDKVSSLKFTGKFNGIIGTFSGQRAAFYEKSLDWWKDFSKKFVESFGLRNIDYTSQGNPNDDIAEYLQIEQRINNILHGFSRDLWEYIKDRFLKQSVSGSGSSTGAAKVNPWRLEHAEAMLEMANGISETLVRNIQEYRLQRDLSDKTLLRFLGTVLGCGLNAREYIVKQLQLITPDDKVMEASINEDWAFLSEALQLILRSNGIENAYELVRSRTQGVKLDPIAWGLLIDRLLNELHIDESNKELFLKLRMMSPHNLFRSNTENLISG